MFRPWYFDGGDEERRRIVDRAVLYQRLGEFLRVGYIYGLNELCAKMPYYIVPPSITFFPDRLRLFDFVMTKCPPVSFTFMLQREWSTSERFVQWFCENAGQCDGDLERIDIVLQSYYIRYLRQYAYRAIRRWALDHEEGYIMIERTMKHLKREDVRIHNMHCDTWFREWVENWCPRCRFQVLPINNCIYDKWDCDHATTFFVRLSDNRDHRDWSRLLEHIMTCGFMTKHGTLILITGTRRPEYRKIIEEHAKTMPIIDKTQVFRFYHNSRSCMISDVAWALRLISGNTRITHNEVLKEMGHEKTHRLCTFDPLLFDTSDASLKNFLRAPDLLLQADVNKISNDTLFGVFKKTKSTAILSQLSAFVVGSYPDAIARNDRLVKYAWSHKRHEWLRRIREYLRNKAVTPLLIGHKDPRSPLSLLDQHTMTLIVNQIYA